MSGHRLLVLRHVKSSWQQPHLDDHDRPLAPRGEAALPKLRAALHGRGRDVEVVLCSSSARTWATLDGVRAALAPAAQVVIDPGLYGAPAATWLSRARALPESSPAALLVGHNPGVADLVDLLTGTGEPDALAQLRAKVPTGALAELHVPGPWTDLAPGTCHLAALQIPRRLEEGGAGQASS